MTKRMDRLPGDNSLAHRGYQYESAEMQELQRFRELARLLAIGLLRNDQRCRSFATSQTTDKSPNRAPSRLEVSRPIGLTVTNPVNSAGEPEPQENIR
jgi:hypothetical protein